MSKMTIIDDELDEIRRCCENVIPDSKVVACVPAMIRVEIRYFLKWIVTKYGRVN